MGPGLIMTTTGMRRESADTRYGAPSRLRPAETVRRPNAEVAAGPFGIPANGAARTGSTTGAMLTALLIVYPAFATVTVIALGLLLGPAGA
jgi:hypothetical protein